MPGTVPEPQPQDPSAVDHEMADADSAGGARAHNHADEDEDEDTTMHMHTNGNGNGNSPEQNTAGGNGDGGGEGGGGGDGADDIDDGSQRIRILPGSTDTAASFQFDREDHTLGNALRYIIMKNPVVEFCGYTIPHPSEDKMNLRIQTWDDASVYDVLEKGLDDLMNLCDVVTEKFTVARDQFRAR